MKFWIKKRVDDEKDAVLHSGPAPRLFNSREEAEAFCISEFLGDPENKEPLIPEGQTLESSGFWIEEVPEETVKEFKPLIELMDLILNELEYLSGVKFPLF